MAQSTPVQESQSEMIYRAAKYAADYILIVGSGRWPEPVKSRIPLFVRRRQAGSAFALRDDGFTTSLGPTETFIHIKGSRYWLAQNGLIYLMIRSSSTFALVDPEHFNHVDAKLASRVMRWLASPDY